MKQTRTPATEGALPYDRKITVPILIAISGILLGGGVGYGMHTSRVSALETWRGEKIAADTALALKIDAIRDSTIRMEEQLKAIAGTLGLPRRP